jgi:hypothetical protein
MASETDICNIALAHLGDSATVASIDPPEGSAQAEHCQRFYPIARDSLLEMHPWGFATRRKALARLSSSPSAWAYCYALPADMINALTVLSPEASDDGLIDGAVSGQAFVIESNSDGVDVLYTNQPLAVLRYVARVTDTTRFSPLFVKCLARALAALLAGPVIKGDAGISMAVQQEVIAFGRDGKSGIFGQAAASDAGDRRSLVRDNHQAPWVSAR